MLPDVIGVGGAAAGVAAEATIFFWGESSWLASVIVASAALRFLVMEGILTVCPFTVRVVGCLKKAGRRQATESRRG